MSITLSEARVVVCRRLGEAHGRGVEWVPFKTVGGSYKNNPDYFILNMAIRHLVDLRQVDKESRGFYRLVDEKVLREWACRDAERKEALAAKQKLRGWGVLVTVPLGGDDQHVGVHVGQLSKLLRRHRDLLQRSVEALEWFLDEYGEEADEADDHVFLIQNIRAALEEA